MAGSEVDLEALLTQVDAKGNFDITQLNSPKRSSTSEEESKEGFEQVKTVVNKLKSKASVGDNTSLGDKLDKFLNVLQRREYELHSNKDAMLQETDADSLIKLQSMRKISMEFSKKSITSRVGEPTVIKVSSRMTCVGTSYGLILVFESNQELQCILGSIQSKEKMLGYKVTSLDISAKSDWCIAGYENGSIIIWDLENGKAIHKAELFTESQVVNVHFLQDRMKFIGSDVNGLLKICNLSKSFFGYSLNIDTIDKKEKNQLRLDISVYHHHPSNGCFVALGSVHEIRIVYIDQEMNYKLCQILPEHHDSSFDQLEERIPYMDWQKPTYYDEIEYEMQGFTSPFRDENATNAEQTIQPPIQIAIGWGNVTDVRTFNPYTGKFDLDIKYSIPSGESERVAGLGWLGDSVLAIITEKMHLSNSMKRIHIVDPYDPSLQQLESFKNFSQYLSNDNEMVRVQDRSVNLTRPKIAVESIDLKCSYESTLLENLFISFYHNHLSVVNGYLYILGKYSVTTCSVLSWKERLDALAKLKSWDELFAMGRDFYLGRGRAVIGLSSNLDQRQRDCAEQFSKHLLAYTDLRLKELNATYADEQGDLIPLKSDIFELIKQFDEDNENEKTLDDVLSKTDQFKYELYELLEKTFNHCLEINYNELIFDDIYQRYKGQYANIYYQVLCEFVNKNKLTIIPPERFTEFFKHGETFIDPKVFNVTLQNLSLSNQSVVKMLSTFTKHNSNYFGAYSHAQTRGMSDFTTPISHMLKYLKTCEDDEERDNVYTVLLNVIDLAMDEHVRTKKEILEKLLDYDNNFTDLKLICAKPKTCNLFLNTLLNVLLDPSSSNRSGQNSYTSEFLFPDHSDLEGYVNQIYIALDTDTKRKVTISDLDTFGIPEDLTNDTAKPNELSPISLEIYMFLGVLFKNEVLSLSNYSMLHRTFIYLIKSATVNFPYPHPRIQRIEDLLKSLLKLVRKASGMSQKHPLMDHYRKLKYLAETQKLNSLVVEFYRSDEKKEDELNLLLDRVEDRDYGNDESTREYDVRLIMEFENRGKFVYETLSKKLQFMEGDDKSEKRKRIELFFLSFLQNVLQDARQKVEQNGTNLTDELHKRRLLINEDFQKCYVTLLARVGSEHEVIEYLEEQPHQLNLDEVLEICKNLPNATSYLYAQKGETQKLLETIVEDLEAKKANLMDYINKQVTTNLEKEWLNQLISLNKKKPRFMEVLSGTSSTPLTPTGTTGGEISLLTPEENFALQYFKLNMDLLRQLNDAPLPQEPDNPLPFEITLLALQDVLKKHNGMQEFLEELSRSYKCQSIDNFDFNRCINEPMTHPPNVALDDMASDKKLQLPFVDGFDILKCAEYQTLKSAVINANTTHLSHMSISKTLDDNDIQNLWFNHLEGPFLGKLRVLQYGFMNKEVLKEQDLREVDLPNNEDTIMTDFTEASDDSDNFFFDDDDESDEEDLDPKTLIENKQKELHEIENTILDLEDKLADDTSNVELKQKILAHREQQIKINNETAELQKQIKLLEEKQHEADIDVNSPRNINRLVNLLLQRCLGDCVLHILESMQRYVDAPSIIEKVVATHSVDSFSRVKNMVMRMLNAYGYDRMLMGRANVLLANDTYKIGAQYHGKLITGTCSEHGNVCMHCQRDLKVGDTDIRLFFCGHMFHVSCLRSPHLCLICSPLSEDDDYYQDQSDQLVNGIETNSSLPLSTRLNRIDNILDRENDILRNQVEFQDQKLGNAADRALEAMSPNKGAVNQIIDDRLSLRGSVPSSYYCDNRSAEDGERLINPTAQFKVEVKYLGLDNLVK
mmetsp:Transcript_2322/g.3363  ORF Transcript_2322/g.3363 Transcript_2322/m.3363 type:complete len:1798 (+) Transcript_2322:77-5470(+)